MKGTLWYTGCDMAALKKIHKRFEKKLGESIEFEYIEDCSLLGGFIAHIDGISYDMSLKHRLDEAREALLDNLLTALTFRTASLIRSLSFPNGFQGLNSATRSMPTERLKARATV